MNNKSFKRIGNIFLSLLIAASFIAYLPYSNIKCYAEKITLSAIDISGAIRPSGKSDFGYKSSESKTLNNGQIQTGSGNNHYEPMWFNGGSGSSKALYCIEPGRQAKSSNNLESKTDIATYMKASTYNKEKYVKTANLTWEDKERLIGYVMGLNNVPLNGKSNTKIVNSFTLNNLTKSASANQNQYYESYLVTQILIWEVILGERDENFVYVNFNKKATHVRDTFKGSTMTSMKSSLCGGLPIKDANGWGDTVGKTVSGTPTCLYAAAVKHIQTAISKRPNFAGSTVDKAPSFKAALSNGKYVYTLNNTVSGALPSKWTYSLKYSDGSAISSSAYSISKTDKTVKITFNSAPTKDVIVTMSRTHKFSAECGGSGTGAMTYYQDTYNAADPNKTIQAFATGYKDPKQSAYVKLTKVDKGTIKITKKVNDTTYINAVGPATAYNGLTFKVTGPNNYSKTFVYAGKNDSNWTLSGANLICTIKDLNTGSYTVTETSGELKYMSRPAGYVQTKTVNVGGTAEFEFTNTMNTAKLRIIKYSEDNDQVINNSSNYKVDGAEFKVKCATKVWNNGIEKTVTLNNTAKDDNGRMYAYYDITNVPVNTVFTVTESKPPLGHDFGKERTKTGKATKKGETITFEFTNPLEKKGISFIKLERHYNADGEMTFPKRMPGVTLYLFKGDVSSENISQLITDKKYIDSKVTSADSASLGVAEFDPVCYGTYTIVEQYDPNGANANYTMMPPKVININAKEHSNLKLYSTYDYNIEMSRSIQAVKIDAGTGQTITDVAEFGLGVDENGNGKYDEGELICLAETEYGKAVFTRTSIAEYLGKDGDITKYFTADTNKLIEFEGKPYYVVETKAPVGYKLNTEIVKITHEEIEKINSGDKVTIVKTVEDFEETGSIKLKKTGETLTKIETSSSDYGEMYDKPIFENMGLKGVTFQFVLEDGKHKGYTITGTTDNKGEINVSDIYTGTYSVKEIGCPEGYIFDDTVYSAVVKANETAEVLTVDKKTINNVRQKVQISLLKAIAGKEDADKTGITFGLYSDGDITLADGTVIIPADSLVNLLVCDAEGNAVSNDNIPYGNYYAKELKTLPGYNLSEDIYKVIAVPSDTKAETTVIKLNDGEPIINTPKSGNLIIVKSFEGMPQDAIANLNVPGEAITSEGDQDTTLKYTLGAGYDKNTFEQMNKNLSVDDLAIMEYIDNDGNTITCFGKQGIPFHIEGTGEDGSVLDEIFYTDENGRIILYNIPVGVYTATEIGGNWTDGYVVEGKFEFSIVNNETTEKAVLNKKEKGKFKFTKSDVSTGEPISNCLIAIRDKNGNKVFEGSTDENGNIEFELDVGNYTYQEIQAPYGYVLDNTEYPFEIKANEICKAEMKNSPILADVEVIKIDENDKKTPLMGAEFAIYSKEDEKKPLQIVVTDKNGKAKFEALRYGEYIIKETKAPKGYTVSSKEVEFKIDEENTFKTSYTFYDSKIPKTGIVTSPTTIIACILGLLTVGFITFRRKHRKEFK